MANIKEAFDYASKNPTSDFAKNLEQLASGGSLDQEAAKYGIDLTEFKPKKNLVDKLVDTGKQTINDLADTGKRVISGETDPRLGVVQAGGDVAKGILDASGKVIDATPVLGTAVKALGEHVIAPTIGGLQALVTKGLNNKLAEEVLASPAAQHLVDFIDANPDIARTATSVNDIANAALMFTGAGKATSIATDVAKAGAEKGVQVATDIAKPVIDAVKPVAQGTVDLIKMAGKGAAQIPDRIATNVAEKQAVESAITALPTKTGQNAVRNGVDIIDVKNLADIPATQETRNLIQTVKDFAAGNTKTDPIEVVGKPIVDRLKELDKTRQEVGAKLGNASKNIGILTKPELQTGVLSRLQSVPGLQEVTQGANGLLDFSKTTLASSLSKLDRKAIQEAYTEATKWGDGIKAHNFRQTLFENLGGKKKSLANITDTQERAFEAIRSGLSDVIESKNPVYKDLSNQYRKIVQPIGDMRKLMKNIDPNSTDDILNMSAGLLARRITSAAASNPQIKQILTALDEAGTKGATKVSVENLQNLYNTLNKYYDIAPKTGFQNLVKEGTQAGSGVMDTISDAVKGLAGNTSAVRQKALESYLKDVHIPGNTTAERITAFPRDTTMTGANSIVQENSIAKYVKDAPAMLKDYIAKHGKVVNTDEARQFFKDTGYHGSNAAAVQEPSSALAKDAWRYLLKESNKPDVLLYAGGSGTGKSSIVNKLLLNEVKDAGAILDGNLSSMSSAEARINEAVKAGKSPTVVYVYRDPVDAWVNGVVKRMNENAAEGGRLVPMSVFLQNHEGSYNVIKKLLESKANDISYNVKMLDNSLGKGSQEFLSKAKFDSIKYASDLKDKLVSETKKLLDNGTIKPYQYDELIK